MKNLMTVGKSIATTCIPPLAIVDTVFTYLLEHNEKKRKEKFNKFFKQLLNGDVSAEKIAYEEDNIKATIEEFSQLFSAAMNDEEEEKISIYVNLYKYIRKNHALPKNLRIRHIKMAKNLPFSAIKLLKSIYIYQTDKIKKPNIAFYEENEFEISLLLKYHILQHGTRFNDFRPTILMDYGDHKNFNEAISMFFTKEELINEACGIKTWKEKEVLIIAQDTLEADKVILILKSFLFDINIACQVTYFREVRYKNISHAIFLVDEPNVKLNFEKIAKEIKSKENVECVKVSFATNIVEKENDILYLNIDDMTEFKKLFSE